MTIIPFPGTKKQEGCGCGKPKRISRLKLPVSSRAFARIRFAGSQGSTKSLLPIEALARLEMALQARIIPDLVELSGPGDPLAEPETTFETLELIHWKYPAMNLGITTLGIGGEQVAESLVQNGVSQVTMLVDAVDPEKIQKLYAWIRPGKKNIPLARAVQVLLDEQAGALKSFRQAGIGVIVKTTVYPGYNDDHVVKVAERVAELGAEAIMIVPYQPRKDEADVPPEPGGEMMDLIHAQAAKRIKVMDEQSGPGEDFFSTLSPESGKILKNGLARPTRERPNVAVVSSNGIDVDLHLGHAIRILVYGPREDGPACLLETRDAPEPGGGSLRWDALADILQDCFALLTASAGESPRKVLGSRGICVMITESEIEGTVDVLYGGGKKKGMKKRSK
ncbi:MAG: radical SAM protein [Desulfobulbaceae bacterium]|nr:radical SAM protein [Desulfobulbaceae bacterium]